MAGALKDHGGRVEPKFVKATLRNVEFLNVAFTNLR